MKLFYIILSLVFVFLFDSHCYAQPQYNVLGLQGGMSISSQKWNSFSRGSLFKPHVDVIFEKYRPGEGKAIYASLGYHLRGNGENIRFFDQFGGGNRNVRLEMKHHNVSFNLGLKGRIVKSSGNAIFYILAARAEVNTKNDFEIYKSFEDEVNPVVGGITFSFGYEWLLTRNGTIIASLSVQPDFTNQIYIQPQTYYIDGVLRSVNEEKIKNFSIELSVGYLFYKERYN